MKFNFKKWKILEERKEDIFRKVNAISDDRKVVKEDFTRLQDHFLRKYDIQRERPIQKQIFIDRKLTYEAIHARLDLMKSKFAAICSSFGLKLDTSARSELIQLYMAMVDLKKLEERHERASSDVNNYLACWNTLQEFSEHHIRLSRLGPLA